MTKREELQTILKQIEILDAQAADCWAKIEPLSTIRNDLGIQIVSEEKLLKGTKWILSSFGNPKLEIEGSLESQPQLADLKKLLGLDIFSSIDFESGIKLNGSFEDISFQFDDPKLMANFVKRMDLVINSNGLVKQLHTLKRQTAALEDLCHMLNLKA